MNKEELIAALQDYLKSFTNNTTGERFPKGQIAFTKYLIRYLTDLEIRGTLSDNIFQYLTTIISDAFHKLKNGEDLQSKVFRGLYEQEVGLKVPDVLNLGGADYIRQCTTVQVVLEFLFEKVTKSTWLKHEIDKYFNAQRTVLQQYFDKFLREVYRTGLFNLVNTNQGYTLTGEFGQTTLSTYSLGGRIQIELRRIPTDRTNKTEAELEDQYFTFVASDKDPLGLTAGVDYVYCDLITAIQMIDEVINNWPKTAPTQKKLFKRKK